jgi:hypothetical protein
MLPDGVKVFPLFGNHPVPVPVVRVVKRGIYLWGGVLVAILAVWFSHRAYLAGRNLVTLKVWDADVRDVVRKCEWQTWETIVVNKDVKGKVTLNVHKVPLEEVLGIIGEQTSSRAAAVYPIFSKGKSVVSLRKVARGDIERAPGWTNFVVRSAFGRRGERGGGPGFGRGGFGGGPGPGGADEGISEGPRSPSTPVTLNVDARDLGFVATALSRAVQSQVVLEDGASALITLHLTDVPFKKVISQVASRAKRKWEVFYTLQAQPDFFADRGDDEERGPRRGRGDGEERGFRRRSEGDTNRWVELRERETAVRLATMTPEEQAKAQEQQQQFEQLRNATPEERQQAFEQMRNNPEARQRFESRQVNRLNNSTSQQRMDRTRRVHEMRERRRQQQQSGGRTR